MSKRGRKACEDADGGEGKGPAKQRHLEAVARTRKGRLSSVASACTVRGNGVGGAAAVNRLTEEGTIAALHACYPRVQELSGRQEEPAPYGATHAATSTTTSGSGGGHRRDTVVREQAAGSCEIPLSGGPRFCSSTSATTSNFTRDSTSSNFTANSTVSNFTPHSTVSNSLTHNCTTSNSTSTSASTTNFTRNSFNFTANSTASNPSQIYTNSTTTPSSSTTSSSTSTTNSNSSTSTPNPTSNSSSATSNAGHLCSASDREERDRRRVELRVQEAKDRATRSRTAPCPLGEDLCRAAQEGRLAAVRRLLDSGAAVNYTDGQGDTPLLLALFPDSHDEVAALLLERGADPDAVSAEGASALHLAAYDRSGRCVALLAAAGARADARKLTGSTPLHYAADVGNAAATRALLAAGASTALRAWDGLWEGKTAADVAGSDDVRGLLDQAAARI